MILNINYYITKYQLKLIKQTTYFFITRRPQNKTFTTINSYLHYVLRRAEQAQKLRLLEIKWIKIVLYN